MHGGCGCDGMRPLMGGYRSTKRNRNMLRRYKRGESIGFTGRSHLKAIGLLPRSNGRYILGPKYSGTGKLKVLSKTRRNKRR